MTALFARLTAAFDHELLLLCLERQLGLCGIVLPWFQSYLSGRSFGVLYGGFVSSIVYTVCSVPQGSVLGPRLFILYSADLALIAKKHGVTFTLSRMTRSFICIVSAMNTSRITVRLEHCIANINHWMSANRPKLNTNKTEELLWAGTKNCLSLHGGSFP